ncbi:MAG TPA: GFA family protein [Polyangiaceae bacterium]
MADSKQAGAGRKFSGHCHCGAVRFEVELPTELRGSRCNCSICTRTAVTSAIVKPEAFELREGAAQLGAYAWGARISTRYFCKECGVHCYGKGFLEAVGGDYVAVNLNCVEGIDVGELEVMHWDGRNDNWQAGPRNSPWPVRTPPDIVA